ncbi:MAG: ABC transporter substrate-binding protein [Dehalococcoidia bacterium]|nr:MAG: ABC transporter substrate-binding protein [Dehalococcoidia bacterium]
MATISRRHFLGATAALAGSGLLAACAPGAQPQPTQPGGSTQPGGTPRRGGTIIYGSPIDPLTLDAHAVGDNYTRRVAYAIYDPLVRESPDKTEILPALAEKWEQSSDGMSWVLSLRKGVKFHDGTPFNAQAAKFNLDRQIDPNHPNNKDGNWLFYRLFLTPIASVDILDEYTIRLNLKQRYAPLMNYLTTNPSYMISPKALQELGKGVADRPVGTGPFRFVSWQKGQQVTLERNPEYWGQTAYADQLIVRAIPDAQGRLLALQTGQINFTVDLPPDSIDLVRGDSRLRVMQRVSRQHWALQLNQKFAPFTDQRVRHAVSLALDRTALTRDVLRNTGVPARGPFSQAFGEWVAPDLPAMDNEPDRARQLLRQAGYDTLEVRFLIPSGGTGMQQPVPMAEFIQGKLAAVGIRVTLDVQEFAAYVQRWNSGDYQMSARGISSVTFDPDNYLNSLFNSINQPPQGLNSAFYKNERFDELANTVRRESDLAIRRQACHEAQRVLMNDMPWVFVDHEIALWYLSTQVNGFVMRDNVEVDWNLLWLA